MKSIGMVRRIDGLGRIVIPIEVRRSNGWEENQALEMFVDGDNFILRASDRVEKQEELKETLLQLQKAIGESASDELKERVANEINKLNEY